MSIRRRHILALGLLCLAPAAAQEASDRGRAAAEDALEAWGSKEGFETELLAPVTDGSAMTTLDGSQSWSQAVSCLSSSRFLEVFFGVGSGGDVTPISIAQDLDLDGTLDITQTLPVPASGVCATGVIACGEGSWEGCEGYQWATAAPDDPTLVLSPAPITDLQGCTCVNNSCGSGLAVLNEAEITNLLSAGMSGALMRHDPRFAVAQLGREAFRFTLAGQETTSCQGAPAIDATSYFEDDSDLASDGSAAAGSSTLFDILETHASYEGTDTIRESCAIERDLRAGGDIASLSISGTGEFALDVVSDTEAVIRLGREGNNTLDESCSVGWVSTVTLQAPDPDSLVSVVIEEIHNDDYSQIHLDGEDTLIWAYPATFTNYTGAPSGPCERSVNEVFTPALDITDEFKDGEAHTLRIRTTVGGRGEQYVRIRVRTACAEELEITDTCAVYAGNEACRLENEQVDGVQTYLAGAHTGLFPLPSARMAGTGSCTVSVTQDWWLRERVYACTIPGGELGPPDLERANYIYENTSVTEWADRRREGDEFITATGPLDTEDFRLEAGCERTCKTRLVATNTQVSMSGVVTDDRRSNEGVIYQYHSCPVSDECPIGEGEELIEPCGCLDDFQDAMVGMQAVRLGGFDFICTTGATETW